jgi:hypothetical protein
MEAEMIYAGNVITSAGIVPSFTSLGCYPLMYILEDGDIVCAECVNTEANFRMVDNAMWNVACADVNWEDANVYCVHCNAHIPAAYELE